jgi:hypothetical protein
MTLIILIVKRTEENGKCVKLLLPNDYFGPLKWFPCMCRNMDTLKELKAMGSSHGQQSHLETKGALTLLPLPKKKLE